MTYLAVAISAHNTEEASTVLQEVAGRADLAELRVDLMESFDLERMLTGRPLPVIVTCRPVREGGQWWGTEEKRLAVLRQAASLGAEYVDLEWDAAAEMDTLDRSRTKVILSRHDFTRMPTDLSAQVAALWAEGPDIIKIVGTARSLADCAPVLGTMRAAARPTIAVAMGAYGLITRLLAFRCPHAFLSFAAPDQALASSAPLAADGAESGTAPGQLRLSTVLKVYRVRSVSANTRFFGLIQPGANSSPLVVAGNAWLSEQSPDARLIPLELGDRESVADALGVLETAAPFAGYLSQESGGETVRARRYRRDRDRNFETIFDALQWLLKAPSAH